MKEPANLLVKISNRSNEDAEEVRLKASATTGRQNRSVPLATLRASKLDTAWFNILHAGWHEAKLSVTDYPVQFDVMIINFAVLRGGAESMAGNQWFATQ
ncbi:MAG: hypothetical protein IPJ82_23060 [Lewinellaceae bacterium]|nr:hypothetical protein [Lewinellaceae bacterium]